MSAAPRYELPTPEEELANAEHQFATCERYTAPWYHYRRWLPYLRSKVADRARLRAEGLLPPLKTSESNTRPLSPGRGSEEPGSLTESRRSDSGAPECHTGDARYRDVSRRGGVTVPVLPSPSCDEPGLITRVQAGATPDDGSGPNRAEQTRTPFSPRRSAHSGPTPNAGEAIPSKGGSGCSLSSPQSSQSSPPEV